MKKEWFGRKERSWRITNEVMHIYSLERVREVFLFCTVISVVAMSDVDKILVNECLPRKLLLICIIIFTLDRVQYI